MLFRATVCGMFLLSMMWIEETSAGSSFLSPADLQKQSMKRPPKSLSQNKAYRREAGDFWDNSVDPLTTNEEAFTFKFPLDVYLLSEEQLKKPDATIKEILARFLLLSPSSQGLCEGEDLSNLVSSLPGRFLRYRRRK